ncbi:membrane protein insertase YidC [Candidatus Saccharibacteria bacterium]|nr:membrane protein insertase YidC [Candidatus Saccharibacteria bacterium]
MNLWNTFLIDPLTSALFFLYQNLGQNLGLAIIALTLGLRILLFPLALPAIRSTKVQQELKPELDKIKKKYKGDRQKMSVAQMELFKKRGVNPFAGCLPQILQLVILIALYRVFIVNLGNGALDPHFLIWDLSVRDRYLILPILAAAVQFFLSKMTLPQVSEEHKAAHEAGGREEDFATAFQRQNLYIFPILTLILGFQFPAGLMLYWLVSSLIQLLQQWVTVRIL